MIREIYDNADNWYHVMQGCRGFDNYWPLLYDDRLIQEFNSLRPSDAYMRRWYNQSLVQTMACRLVATKPLSELLLGNYLLELKEQNSIKF